MGERDQCRKVTRKGISCLPIRPNDSDSHNQHDNKEVNPITK